MTDQRLDIEEVAPDGYQALLDLETYVRRRVDRRLLLLVKVRASVLNGCSYCTDLHATRAVDAGEDVRRLARSRGRPEVISLHRRGADCPRADRCGHLDRTGRGARRPVGGDRRCIRRGRDGGSHPGDRHHQRVESRCGVDPDDPAGHEGLVSGVSEVGPGCRLELEDDRLRARPQVAAWQRRPTPPSWWSARSSARRTSNDVCRT